jgi:thiol:disulfide interchange protein DsbC
VPLQLVLMIFALSLGLSPAASADEPADLKKVLAELIPDAQPDSIIAAPLAGFYEVAYGPQIIYISKDGHYVLQGDILDARERKNLTEERRSAKRIAAIDSVSEDKMIVFAPKQVKHTISVFTDIDCGYCRKLHQEINEFTAQGIKVRYLAFPRAGIGSPSYEKAVSVWCAADRNTAITRAKAGKEIEKKDCDNPVKAEYELGRRVGVNGTPSIVLEDGSMLPGYVPPRKLSHMLDVAKANP